jgi:sugar lactone lactonase YvrE
MNINKYNLRFNSFKKLSLIVPLSFLFFNASSFATTTYTLSTFLDMCPTSSFAQQYCPANNCAVEGSAKDSKGNLYLAMALPKGQIFKVTPEGTASVYATFPISNAQDPAAVDFDAVNLRLAFDKHDVMYATYIDVVDTVSKVPTAYTGVWKIPVGGGNCSLSSGPCVKIFPQNLTTPLLRFPDGLDLDGKGNLYIADPQMGNIWKIDLDTGNGAVWAGVDAGSSPNYLKGNPFNIILGFSTNPLVNRGLGIVSLALDKKADNIYAATFDDGSVVRIPINNDGSAGAQQVLLDVSAQDKQLDAIYIDKKDNVVYVTNDNSQFNALINFIFNGGPFVPPIDGHEIYAGKINKHDNSVVFSSIINDPIIGVTTGVINGIDKKNDNTLYIDVFGSVEGATKPKIVKAVPVDD